MALQTMSRVFVFIAAIASMALIPLDAAAEHRVALVIGNGDYKAVGTLANPANDARLLAGTLRSLASRSWEKERNLISTSAVLSGSSSRSAGNCRPATSRCSSTQDMDCRFAAEITYCPLMLR
jgi:hypothetical protein